MYDRNAPPNQAGGGRPLGKAPDELGVPLTRLFEADVTLVVSGKDDEPKVTLEIELKEGRTITRPLPEQFIDEKTRRIRVEELATWLNLDEAPLVDSLANSGSDMAAFIDRSNLARSFDVKEDAPLSAVPVTLKRSKRSGWSLQLSPLWKGLDRLPLGKVGGLADPEKISYEPVAAAVGADAGESSAAFGAGDVMPLDDEDDALLRRGCLGWFADHKVLAAGGFAALFLLVVVAVILFGGDDGDSGSGTRDSGEVATEGDGLDLLAVDAYADRACGIFADNLVGPGERFRAALDDAAAAPAATPELYDEIEAAAVAFATGLGATAESLSVTPAPDVEGGPAAHASIVSDYREAALAADAVAVAAAGYDPTTATEEDTAAVGVEINAALTDLNDALGPSPDAVPEVDAAFAASERCVALEESPTG